jgi:hypothetical protein
MTDFSIADPRTRCGPFDVDGREQFARREQGRKDIDKKILCRNASRTCRGGNFNVRVQCDHNGRPVGRRIGIRQGAADGAAIAYLRIGDEARGLTENRQRSMKRLRGK